MFDLIGIAYANSHTATCVAQGFLDKIYDAVFWPLIVLLTAAALLYFLYGAFKFVANAHNAAERETGRRHMIFGIIGLFVMIAALAILTIAANTFGIGFPDECYSNDPNVPGSIPGNADGSIGG